VTLSPPIRLLVRPFRGYEELAAATSDDAPTIAGGALRLLFVIGATVALTATGRLAPIELAVAMVSFAYVPLVQLVSLAAALRLVARSVPFKRAYALHLAGNGPFVIGLVAIAAVALLAPAESTAPILLAFVPPLVLLTLVWSGFLTYACFRRGLGLGRARAGLAALAQTIFMVSVVVAYYLGMGQLAPQLGAR
jgi:hypothetical protein